MIGFARSLHRRMTGDSEDRGCAGNLTLFQHFRKRRPNGLAHHDCHATHAGDKSANTNLSKSLHLTASKRTSAARTISGPTISESPSVVAVVGAVRIFIELRQPAMAFRKPFTRRSISRSGTEQRPTRSAPCTGTTKIPSSLSREATRRESGQNTVVKNPPS